MEKQFWIYMITNKPEGVLYIGVTSELVQRIWQHKERCVPGFTSRYNLDRLVYFEEHAEAEAAIRREKRLKFWRREWKLDLVRKFNPDWQDLYPVITGERSCGQAAG